MLSPASELGTKHAWATTFYSRVWQAHPAEASGIVEFLYRLKAAEPPGIASGVAVGAKSAGGLYESTFDLFDHDHPGLQRLVGFIDETVRAAVAHVNGGEVDPARLRVRIPDSWCHITNGGGFHDTHSHFGCSWCGIYYVQLGDSGRPGGGGAPNGGSRFYSPLLTGGAYRDYGNAYLDVSSLDPPVRDGLLLLFPSYLLHSGLPYCGGRDRIVIAFNARIELRDLEPGPID